MSWTAIVPIKPAPARKTRLGGIGAGERLALTDRMLAHVLGVLQAHADIEEVILLSARPYAGFGWIEDEARGLNAELQAARRYYGDLLIVHADLPLLSEEDISTLLLRARKTGGAIAPDRHGSGTNALALPSGIDVDFRFGPNSRHFHAAALPGASIVECPGLALDVDTPEDLLLAGGSVVACPA